MIPIHYQTTGRRWRAEIPFLSQNVLALDANDPALFTLDASDHILIAHDAGPNNNDFDGHSGLEPTLTGGEMLFNGDHMHRPGGLIPAIGDWTWVCRFRPSFVSFRALLSQWVNSHPDTEIILRTTNSGQFAATGLGLQGGSYTADSVNTAVVQRDGNTGILRFNGAKVDTSDLSGVSIAQVGNLIGSRTNTTTGHDDSPYADPWAGSIVRMGLWTEAVNSLAVENWAES